MVQLAIKGREYSDEVIEIFEMLGGRNINEYNGYSESLYYYIDEDGSIECDKDEEIPFPCIYFTLEEFLEKYPHKVGDKVNYVKYNDEYSSVYTIQGMRWTGATIEYLLDSSGFSALTKDLQSYKEKTMEEKKINQMSIANCDLDEVEIVLGDKFELVNREGKYYAVKKKLQFPNTYEKCCKVLNIIPGNVLLFNNPNEENDYVYDNEELYNNFDKLKVCRDAYWKIAGEQMGLDGAWKPDWSSDLSKYYISFYNNKLDKGIVNYSNKILAFPTEEMRDYFYENFKKLIEECKELL